MGFTKFLMKIYGLDLRFELRLVYEICNKIDALCSKVLR